MLYYTGCISPSFRYLYASHFSIHQRYICAKVNNGMGSLDASQDSATIRDSVSTHFGRDKMADFLQTSFSNSLLKMETVAFYSPFAEMCSICLMNHMPVLALTIAYRKVILSTNDGGFISDRQMFHWVSMSQKFQCPIKVIRKVQLHILVKRNIVFHTIMIINMWWRVYIYIYIYCNIQVIFINPQQGQITKNGSGKYIICRKCSLKVRMIKHRVAISLSHETNPVDNFTLVVELENKKKGVWHCHMI